MPIGFIDGLWWPLGDRDCRPAVARQFKDALVAIKYVKHLRVCVQAGGNCGVWASFLAGHFDEVWTIEADLTNYLCLLKNTVGMRAVRPIWGALSNKSGGVDLRRDRANIGAHYIDNASSRVTVATLTIDELELEMCDFIQLDIEGHEPIALEGARATIERFKPVIMVEDNGSCERFGFQRGWENNFPGYRVQATINRDVILVPC